MTTACIVLAAGDSTRMRSALPKVLHALCGQPVIDYVSQLATALKCRPVVTVVGAAAADVRARLPRAWIAVHQPVRRGTGHAVALALKKIPRSVRTVLVLYGDQPLVWPHTVQRLIETHQTHRAACTVLTSQSPWGGAGSYGRIVRHGQLLVRIVEAADATPVQRDIQEINVGVTIFERHALAQALRHVTTHNAKGEYYLTDAANWLAAHEALGPVLVDDAACAEEALGINSRHDLSTATGLLHRRTIARLRHEGVTIVEGRTTFIDPDVRVGQDTIIHPGCVIARGVVIGQRCQIGPYAHLRVGAHIGDETRVGNFTEVTRSRLGKRVRMNHFSYVGDSHVGDDVNLGAGTVTANYDGRAKHRTRIGSRAFVGSGTVLVAPTVLGARAVTGAGAVVTKGTHVPAGATVVGVPAQERQRRTATRRQRGRAPRR